MKKTASIIVLLLVLGFAASAHATAIYSMEGFYFRYSDLPDSQQYFSGSISIQGVNTILDLQQGQTYEWDYNVSYFNGDRQLLGASSHEGSVEVLNALIFPGDKKPFQLAMLGDNNSQLFCTAIDGFIWEEDTFFPTPNTVLGGYADKFELVSVPEPSIVLMIGCSLFSLVIFGKKMRSA